MARSRSADRPQKPVRSLSQQDDTRFPGANRGKFSGPGRAGFRRSPESSPERASTSRPQDTKRKPDFDPYRDNSGGRGDKDYRTLPPQAGRSLSPSPGPTARLPKERFDQTVITLSDRFLRITGPLPPFSPAENITIGIDRSLTGNMPAIIPRELFPTEVVMLRRKDEGVKPFYQRPEFLGPKEEVVEKRTIKMEEPRHKQKVSVGPVVRPLLNDRWSADKKTREDLDK